MKTIQYFSVLLLSLIGTSSLVFCQNTPIVLEAEDAVIGSDFSTLQEGMRTFVSINTNGTADNPENENRVLSFEVNFPAAQDYDLYVRCRVGSGGANDDSFFYGTSFGEQPFVGDSWVSVNNIYNIGYNQLADYVDGDGQVGTGLWKWINLSEFTGDEPPVVFTVNEGELTQVFQIGAREDGFEIDKIAFARADYFFTVANLNEATEGSPEIPLLQPIAQGKSKFLGNIYSTSQVVDFTQYWNQVTPENAGKWGSVEATRDQMNWTQLDAAYALAQDNGYLFKLHVLIWGNQQPNWMETLQSAEQREEIEEWFQAVADRYPNLEVIEVVNEPLHDPPTAGSGNYIQALGGYGSTGWEWVMESFRLARQYFPNSQLMLNDYNIINSISNTQDYLEIIQLLQAENLIDQIGVQAHAFTTGGSITTMTNNIETLGTTTGLPVYITELDIDGETDQIQLDDYMEIFPAFWEHLNVHGITLWGWRPGLWRNDEKAYLIDTDGSERPALIWLRNYVMSTVLGVDNIATSNHITISPNPIQTGGTLNISGLEQAESFTLFDINGRSLSSGSITGTSLSISSELSSGYYFLALFDGKHTYVKKLVVN
ncbi:MAG: endo-1,4-beta-xylanase [Lewinella sp.]|uniref:endo-1,4-beta-xylanase n=1 Tax=Lewinella sp. TaxID=2004506 RepID=UPI003D6B2601